MAEKKTRKPRRAKEETPESELPGGPTIDLRVVAGEAQGEGSVESTGRRAGLSDPIPPATRQADGAPQPPQPTGADTASGPIGQVSKPGTLASVSTATNAANARRMQKEDGGKERAAALRSDQTTDRPDDVQPNPGIELSAPLAQNTLLTITGRNFPPRERVTVDLSHSATPSGVTLLRTDQDGTVQVSIFPAPGKQSVSFKAETAEASAQFEVAPAPSFDPEGDEQEDR